MSNRLYTQFRYSLEKKVVDLFADVTFGATGAPTLVQAGKSKGIKSISRSAAGKYVVTFQDTFVGILMVKAVFINATAPASPSMFIVSSTTSSVTLQFNAAGVATDPASGEEVLLQFVLKDSAAL